MYLEKLIYNRKNHKRARKKEETSSPWIMDAILYIIKTVRTEGLLDNWMKEHHDKDCYPPTIINITDGEYNGVTDDEMLQLANQLKSMFTNDGNVLFFNIHIVPGHSESVVFPATVGELNGNGYGEKLFNMSSLLPLNYNEQIRGIFGDRQTDIRYRAMGVNAGMERLVKMMKIGTLSSTLANQL